MRSSGTRDQSRAELFAEETLGRDRGSIRARLSRRSVVIGITACLAATRQGQLGLVTVVNILTRLGVLAPKLYLDVPEHARVLPGVPLLPADQPLGQSLLAFMRELAAFQKIDVTRAPADNRLRYECGVFIGKTRFDVEHAVTIGANGWLAAVNPSGYPEEIVARDPNPMGIVLAATLGAAEVVKWLWLPIKDSQVAMEPMLDRTVMSTFDWRINSARPANPAFPPRCELGHASIFGLGAIGSGCNYVLGCLPDLHMSLDLVDMDRIDSSNEERLFTSNQPRANRNLLKVFHAQRFIRTLHQGVQALVFPFPFQRYVDTARNQLDYVMCCLDSAPLRRVLQTELASIVVNGATDLSRWMVSLHEFGRPENSCLIDLYNERELDDFPVALAVAHYLGVPVETINRLLGRGEPLPLPIMQAAIREWKDRRARGDIACYAEVLSDEAAGDTCTRMRPSQAMPAATISFVSLMPAIFMVADLVKRRSYGWSLPAAEPNIFQFDALRLPSQGMITNILASRNCFCQSARYRGAFQERMRLRRKFTERVALTQARSRRLGSEPLPRIRRRIIQE